jgi:hypothetical protein
MNLLRKLLSSDHLPGVVFDTGDRGVGGGPAGTGGAGGKGGRGGGAQGGSQGRGGNSNAGGGVGGRGGEGPGSRNNVSGGFSAAKHGGDTVSGGGHSAYGGGFTSPGGYNNVTGQERMARIGDRTASASMSGFSNGTSSGASPTGIGGGIGPGQGNAGMRSAQLSRDAFNAAASAAAAGFGRTQGSPASAPAPRPAPPIARPPATVATVAPPVSTATLAPPQLSTPPSVPALASPAQIAAVTGWASSVAAPAPNVASMAMNPGTPAGPMAQTSAPNLAAAQRAQTSQQPAATKSSNYGQRTNTGMPASVASRDTTTSAEAANVGVSPRGDFGGYTGPSANRSGFGMASSDASTGTPMSSEKGDFAGYASRPGSDQSFGAFANEARDPGVMGVYGGVAARGQTAQPSHRRNAAAPYGPATHMGVPAGTPPGTYGPVVGMTPQEADLLAKLAFAEVSTVKTPYGQTDPNAIVGVAQTVKNRTMAKAYPKSPYAVMTQPKQFSPLNQTTPAAFAKRPAPPAHFGTLTAMTMAGQLPNPIGTATNYGNLSAIANPSSIANPAQRPSKSSQSAFANMAANPNTSHFGNHTATGQTSFGTTQKGHYGGFVAKDAYANQMGNYAGDPVGVGLPGRPSGMTSSTDARSRSPNVSKSGTMSGNVSGIGGPSNQKARGADAGPARAAAVSGRSVAAEPASRWGAQQGVELSDTPMAGSLSETVGQTTSVGINVGSRLAKGQTVTSDSMLGRMAGIPDGMSVSKTKEGRISVGIKGNSALGKSIGRALGRIGDAMSKW